VPLLLRGSLGLTFVWFGALKLAGQPTLPASLIAAITPMLDPDLSVPLVGAVEVALGAGLLVGRFMPVFLAGVALQLSGTFLVLVLRPDVAFVDGNPLVLGEYVVKNLVLLAAIAALALHTLSPRPDSTTAHRLPDAHDPAHRTQPRRRHDRRICERPRTQKSLLDLMINGRRSKVRRESGAAALVTPPHAKAAA
jgi:putative oxidoreductase